METVSSRIDGTMTPLAEMLGRLAMIPSLNPRTAKLGLPGP